MRSLRLDELLRAVSSIVFDFAKLDSSIVHDPFADEPSSSDEDIDDNDSLFSSRASSLALAFAAADASSVDDAVLLLRLDIFTELSGC